MSARAEVTANPTSERPVPLTRGGGPRPAFAAGACLAIALVFSLEASGGIANDGRRPTAVETMARVPASDKRPTLRCWQYGRLVYEASDVHLIRDGNGPGDGGAVEPATSSTATPSPDPKAGRADAKGADRPAGAAEGRRRVRLLDLNQGLCIID